MKVYLILAAVITLVIGFLILAFMFKKKEAKDNEDLYKSELKKNVALEAAVMKMEAEQEIKAEEEKKANAKISQAHSGSNRERFNFINNGLRNK